MAPLTSSGTESFSPSGLDLELAMGAVAAQMAVAVVEHVRGGGHHVVGKRELAGAMRVAAADDAGAGVAAAQFGGVQFTLEREILERGALVGAEHHDRRDRRRAR